MTIDDFKKLGFVKTSGFHHPTGCDYTLIIKGRTQLQTTDVYVGYLWHSFNYPYNNRIITRKCTPEIIEQAKKWETEEDVVIFD